MTLREKIARALAEILVLDLKFEATSREGLRITFPSGYIDCLALADVAIVTMRKWDEDALGPDGLLKLHRFRHGLRHSPIQDSINVRKVIGVIPDGDGVHGTDEICGELQDGA